MQRFGTKSIIFFNALLLGIVVFVSVFFLRVYLINPYIIILISLVIFIVGFVSINYSIRKIVLKSILPLYKLIQSTTISEAQLKRDLKNSDPIDEFTEDFDLWANARKSEMNQLPCYPQKLKPCQNRFMKLDLA